jgi:MYND finger/HECT-like Ubiquitin-conjugating enzyme (E2)-binding
MNCCHVCRKEDCKLLRCSGCRNVQYCSKACQVKDWKDGHRRVCTKAPGSSQGDLEVKAQRAMAELQTILAGNHSLDTLAADRHKALDALERLRVSESKSKRSKTPRKTSPPKPAPPKPPPPPKTTTIQRKAASHWDFWMENLIHISCYQIVLRPNPTQRQSMESFDEWAQQLQISIAFDSSHDSSTVVVRHPQQIPPELFSQRLPGKIHPQPKSFQIFDHSLNLQFQYDPPPDPAASISLTSSNNTSQLKNATQANQLACKYCHWKLIQPTAQIDRLVPMPSAHWDDIADYLICYSGVSRSREEPRGKTIIIVHWIHSG